MILNSVAFGATERGWTTLVDHIGLVWLNQSKVSREETLVQSKVSREDTLAQSKVSREDTLVLALSFRFVPTQNALVQVDKCILLPGGSPFGRNKKSERRKLHSNTIVAPGKAILREHRNKTKHKR